MRALRRYEPHIPHHLERLRGLPLASFWRRGGALAVDLFISGMLLVLLVVLGAKLLTAAGWNWWDETADIMVQVRFFDNWYSVIWHVAFLGLSNHLGNGRTLGKRVLKVRAVSLVHEELRGWPAFERALAYGASCLELGFGFIQYFFHPNRQTVHDRIAETIVIDEQGPDAAR